MRIWTTRGELPLAGHLTLDSAHAWLESGRRPACDVAVLQECGVLMRHPDGVLAADPCPSRCAGLEVGLVAAYPPGVRDDGVAAEVRAFSSADRDFAAEDPVTGSLNAGLAQWLVPAGRPPRSYVAAQGTVLDRLGRVHVDVVDGTVWVGDATRTLVSGELSLRRARRQPSYGVVWTTLTSTCLPLGAS